MARVQKRKEQTVKLMEEKIYTIPVNEAFDETDGCPFCRLYKKLEDDELDLILGASMMEPDIRIQTNKLGFCGKHDRRMFGMKNRLGMGLMLESHLDAIRKSVETKPSLFSKDAGAATAKDLETLTHSCYVCEKIEGKLSKMFETAVLLWEREKEFRAKNAAQPYFCLPHYARYIRTASVKLPKKLYPDFLKAQNELEMAYFDKLSGDVSWFCKKFDYRYDSEPWGDSKDAVERSIAFLNGCE